MESLLCSGINRKLIDYITHFPFPYMDILQGQIAACQITSEQHPDCYIIHFHCRKDAKQLPLWLPEVPQACQILKENGPLLCQLYIESGYIVQFEVVDMGMNEIDWEYLWSHKPVFDVEYDLPAICRFLATEKPRISKVRVGQQNVYLKVDVADRSCILGLWDCNIYSPGLLSCSRYSFMDISVLEQENHRYLVLFDDNVVLECSLISLGDKGTVLFPPSTD